MVWPPTKTFLGQAVGFLRPALSFAERRSSLSGSDDLPRPGVWGCRGPCPPKLFSTGGCVGRSTTARLCGRCWPICLPHYPECGRFSWAVAFNYPFPSGGLGPSKLKENQATSTRAGGTQRRNETRTLIRPARFPGARWLDRDCPQRLRTMVSRCPVRQAPRWPQLIGVAPPGT